MAPRRAIRSAISIAATVGVAAAGPCDIYASGNTPCVAAHSSVRALYKAYNSALYQVIRGSDNATSDISPLSAGGVANAAAQDRFCSGTTCLIKTIYDQSGNGNHLTQALHGYWPGPDYNENDNLASAIGAPVTLNGNKAYGVFIPPGTGYRVDTGNKVATGDAPEGIYGVFDGSHFNGGCCFDYGNAENSRTDTGAGHMETIYFGNDNGYSYGDGNGPWIMSDLENGLFPGNNFGYNSDPAVTTRFVTGIVKGNSGNQWSIRHGDSQTGLLNTTFSGVRPNGYNPMNKEGGIILGIGGDNSNDGQGTFYEGVLTSGYPSDNIENQVQANIVAAKYAVTSLVGGPAMTVGSTVTFRVTTPGYNTRCIVHSGQNINTAVVSSSSDSGTQKTASWIVRTGLGNSGCYSFESADTSGSFIRHSGFQLYLNSNDNSKGFAEDATFCPLAGLNGQGNSIRSWSYPTRFFRHYGNVLYVGSNGGQESFDNPSSYNNDVSFVVSGGFSS